MKKPTKMKINLKKRPAGAELMSAIMRMLQEKTPIKVIFKGDWAGFIVFAVSYVNLGLSHKMMSHPFYKSKSTLNFIGELLVRQNMDMFADRLLVKKNYNSLVKSRRHRNFKLVKSYRYRNSKLRIKNDKMLNFRFHISLFHRLYRERKHDSL